MFSILCFPLLNSLLIGLCGRLFGRFGSSVISIFVMFTNLMFSLLLYTYTFSYHFFIFFDNGSWIDLKFLKVFWSVSFDSITISMFLVVNIVSFVVHSYSTFYLQNDPHLNRFLSYVSLFTFFMLVLVSSDSFLQLFLGWEGVGLCSYLSIGFWYTRSLAISSALKALVVNRLSDFAFMFGIVYSYYLCFSLDIPVLLSYLSLGGDNENFLNFNVFILSLNASTIVCFLFTVGAMGKSAQILFHIWLPEAMEGPTPVSALIHAATMVTAGVFLLLKCSVILEFSSVSINLLLLIGGLTAFMSGTIGILQFDVKKVIAYSTCSQLGYMLLTAGFLNQNLALYHLTNHAFFKALLFSGAGCIIHSSLNEQDIRKFGSFSKLFRLIFMFFIIGSLALCGFIFLTGYYSKDFILESIIFIFNYFSVGVNVSLIIAFLTTTTIITSLYSVRLIHLTFINHPLYSYAALKMLKESSFVLTFPLWILVVGSIFFGYLAREFFIGIGVNSFVLNFSQESSINFSSEVEIFNLLKKVFFIFCFTVLPMILFFTDYYKNKKRRNLVYRPQFVQHKLMLWRDIYLYKNYRNFRIINIYSFLSSKWGFDVIFNKFFFIFLYTHVSLSVYELLDKFILESFFGHRQFITIMKNFSLTFKPLIHSGRIYYYFLSFLILALFII